MKKNLILIAFSAIMTGCASVPMETEENNNYAKEFNPPREGMSGIYIYRESIFGAALKKIYLLMMNVLEKLL